ncbi:hypothetical protein HZS_1186, partial [Henneguya salminicola]
STGLFSTLATSTYNFREDKNIEPKYFGDIILQRENMPYPFRISDSDRIIPNEFKNTLRGEPFTAADILFESGERTIIFASRRNQNYFPETRRIYFYATFHATNFTTNVACV